MVKQFHLSNSTGIVAPNLLYNVPAIYSFAEPLSPAGSRIPDRPLLSPQCPLDPLCSSLSSTYSASVSLKVAMHKDYTLTEPAVLAERKVYKDSPCHRNSSHRRLFSA